MNATLDSYCCDTAAVVNAVVVLFKVKDHLCMFTSGVSQCGGDRKVNALGGFQPRLSATSTRKTTMLAARPVGRQH